MFSGLYPQLAVGRLAPEEYREELVECIDREDFTSGLDGQDCHILGAAAPAYAGDVYPNSDTDPESSDYDTDSSDSGVEVCSF